MAVAIGSSQKAAALASASPSAGAVPGQALKIEILRNLAQGVSGEDVKSLQHVLLDEGVYPAGLVTGYFGDMTRQAVIKFQEKYAPDILTPAGLANGTGFVGPGTRKKINEILAKRSTTGQGSQKAELPPGQAIKAAILRNLTQGDSGEDVKYLQQLLLDENLYPEGLITGYFGQLTKQAVIRFQEKYAEQILKPAGLGTGTGFVGPSTRKKIDSLIK